MAKKDAQDKNNTSETAATAVKRARKVGVKIRLPEGDSTTGAISLQIVGREVPYVYDVDFAALSPQVVFAATLSGIAAKFATAFASDKTPEDIIASVDKVIDAIAKGEFASRTLREKVVAIPDIIVAWMTAAGADINDQAAVAKYVSSWESRDDAGKATITNNVAVITKLEELQAARRLEKKVKSAVQDELEVL